MKVYLDNAASTPLFEVAKDRMAKGLTTFIGNPSSIHSFGREARAEIEKARKLIADGLQSSIGEIFFTSGGTESNNMAIKCAVRDLGVTRIITTPIEHHCVLRSIDRVLSTAKIAVEYLEVDSQGFISLDQLEQLLKGCSDKTLVSIIHGNNEIGTIQDLDAIEKICHTYNAYLHTDTVQTIAHYPFQLANRGIHFLSASGHKFHGPKGTGFLYMNQDAVLQPFIDGGAQERNMRAGTENVYGISAMAAAFDQYQSHREEYKNHVMALRQKLKNGLAEIEGISFNGPDNDGGLYTILNVQFAPPIGNDTLLLLLDMKGIAASGGSACSSGANQGSHVMKAIKPNEEGVSVRFSFSHMNRMEEIHYVIQSVQEMSKQTT